MITLKVIKAEIFGGHLFFAKINNCEISYLKVGDFRKLLPSGRLLKLIRQLSYKQF